MTSKSSALTAISERLQRVTNECSKSGARLIAVSKGHDIEKIKQAYELGQRDFGESFAQEFIKKYNYFNKDEYPGIIWHFIGNIQSNKAKLIAQADVIHSVGTMAHAIKINDVAKAKKNILLQVNLNKNPNQSGFDADHIDEIIFKIRKLPNITIAGLMCIAPLGTSYPPEYWFKKLRNLGSDLQTQFGITLKLSMGMSSDYEAALKNGAHYIRIGTDIFGPRNL